MSELLLYYHRPEPTTWVYMSSFLIIGLYFVFHRVWSIRNLDIVLLILLAPGLLMVHEGQRSQLRQRDIQLIHESQERSPNAMLQGDIPASNGQPDSLESVPEDPFIDSSQTHEQVHSELNPEMEAESATRDELEVDTEGFNHLEDGMENIEIATDQVDSISFEDNLDSETPETTYSWKTLKRGGFIWLFVIEACILVRLLFDPMMVRRPLLDPNLTTGGLNFIGISLFIFMMANVVRSNPQIQEEQGPQLGPGYALMNMLPAIPTRVVSESVGGAAPRTISELTLREQRIATIAKVLAILAQVSIVVAIVMIGKRHFNNLCAGTGCALLYLLLPYTAQMTGRVDHALPAALLLWAILNYRKPVVAGVFMGLAAGLVYYPLFLLPLWFSFYWQRGARRFSLGVASMLAVLMVLLLLFGGAEPLMGHLQQMFGLRLPTNTPQGVWALGWAPVWRLPVIVGFVILCTLFAVWPAQKNLGTLISCSAAVMAGAQFWHGYGGGLYIAWFLPMLLLTIFRPNLQDRVAVKVVRPNSPKKTAVRLAADAP